MADRAIGREARCYVGWVGGASKVRLVAAVAGRRQRTGVVIVGVAAGARHCRVRARQRERRVVVVERRRGPARGRVALRAVRRECGGVGRVRRIRGPVVVRLVAADAGCRQRTRVVIVGVAAGARHCRVRARQWERCVVVVERRGCPACGVMALRAIRREARGHVVWIGRPGEVRLVAGIAGRRRIHVVVVGVALNTGQRGMHTRQRVVCIERVIKLGIEPIRRAMAGTAVVRQVQLHVRRIVGIHKIGRVARIAGRRCSSEDIVDVTSRARQCGVSPGQRIAREFQVIELCIEPGIHRVTRLAGCREPRRYMIEHRGLKILLVAGVAGGR